MDKPLFKPVLNVIRFDKIASRLIVPVAPSNLNQTLINTVVIKFATEFREQQYKYVLIATQRHGDPGPDRLGPRLS